MAGYKAKIEAPSDPGKAFEFLSNFANTREWDPSVKRTRELDEGPVAVGSRFELTLDFAGKENTLTYEVVELDPGRRVLLRAENDGVISLDEITVENADAGTLVTYDADLKFKGMMRVLDPAFKIVFGRLGDRAKQGMLERLSQPDLAP
jgi:hypothetical protein